MQVNIFTEAYVTNKMKYCTLINYVSSLITHLSSFFFFFFGLKINFQCWWEQFRSQLLSASVPILSAQFVCWSFKDYIIK